MISDKYVVAQNDQNYQLRGGDVGTVVELILVGGLPGSLDQHSIIRAHATVDHADVVSDLLDLEYGLLLVQERFVLLL